MECHSIEKKDCYNTEGAPNNAWYFLPFGRALQICVIFSIISLTISGCEQKKRDPDGLKVVSAKATIPATPSTAQSPETDLGISSKVTTCSG